LLRGPLGWIVLGVAAAYLLHLGHREWKARTVEIAQAPDDGMPQWPSPAEVAEQAKKRIAVTAPKKVSEPDGFLDDFNKKDTEPEKDSSTVALSNGELERQFEALTEINRQLDELKKRAKAAGASITDKEFTEATATRDRLLDRFNRQAGLLEKALPRARQARPDDPAPRWLTGELLMLIGGEPEEVLPHLQYALSKGLKNPRLFGSLARIQLGANEFATSFQSAGDALERHGQDRYLWNAFMQAAVSTHQFEAVLNRLDRAFPLGLPDWAKICRRSGSANRRSAPPRRKPMTCRAFGW
jgi:hypothetical protein